MSLNLPDVVSFDGLQIHGPAMPPCVWVDATTGHEWDRTVSNTGFVFLVFQPNWLSPELPTVFITVDWANGLLLDSRQGASDFYDWDGEAFRGRDHALSA